MKIKLSETEIKSQCKDYLTWTGWFTFPILQGLGARKGICDSIAVKDGRVLFIEYKTERGKQSPYQVEFQKQIELHGGTYWLIHSLDELIEKLKEK